MRLTDVQVKRLSEYVLKYLATDPNTPLEDVVVMRGKSTDWYPMIDLIKHVGRWEAMGEMDWVLKPRGLQIIRTWLAEGFVADSFDRTINGDEAVIVALQTSALEFRDKHPRPEPISLNKLYDALGYKGKIIPLDVALTHLNVPCPSRGEGVVGTFHVTVLPNIDNTHSNSSRHRVFVKCRCSRKVPFGRLHQHQCPYSYEFADEYPFKTYNKLNGKTTYHKSLETASAAMRKTSQLFEWDLKADKWVETKPVVL